VTTFTDRRACEHDTGLLARHCWCSACSDLREEFYELHRAKAEAYLSDRPDDEKEARMAAIEEHIQRYGEWL